MERIFKMVQVMYETPAERWGESLRVGIMVQLFKKELGGR